MNEISIPARFSREIILHLYKNLMPNPERSVPLILGIHGPSGEGKTYQCEQLVGSLGVEAILVSGGELESVDAGEPARLVREKYLECAKLRESRGCKFGPAALIFNDIDAAIGNWGDTVQYTVNRQNIFGELMHLADFPNDVDGRKVQRVPIILTGNDFTKLYGPLIRPGRLRAFPWLPTTGERAEVLQRLFSELSADECAKLVAEFPGMPVAFFAAIRDDLVDDILWQHIVAVGARESLDRLSNGLRPKLPRQVSMAAIIATGNRIRQASQYVDHLKE